MINPAQLHLALNHAPIFGLFFGLGILLYGFILKHPTVRRVGAAVLAIGALSVVAAFLSGEPAEDMMEHRPGISEDRIEEHEKAGEWSLYLALLAGSAAGLGLLLPRRFAAHEKKAMVAAAALSFVALATLARTAHLGGQISHPELRAETLPAK